MTGIQDHLNCIQCSINKSISLLKLIPIYIKLKTIFYQSFERSGEIQIFIHLENL